VKTCFFKIIAGAAFFTLMLGAASPSRAGEVTVAVATNFLNPLKQLAAGFQKEKGHRVRIVSGSTGKLYAQIIHGAPFDVFLAADGERPRLLADHHPPVARAETRFTYAVGRLALWSADPQTLSGNGPEILRAKRFNHLALANPDTAPYGRAARSVIERLKLKEALAPLIVQGENIGQAFQFTATGNAEIGFVALSQLMDPRMKIQGSRWVVPEDLHDPIEQDAILLSRGTTNPAARAFMDYLISPPARTLIQSYGYGLKP